MQENSSPPSPIYYGGFWLRFLAFLIDSVLLGLISGILFFFLPSSLGVTSAIPILVTIPTGMGGNLIMWATWLLPIILILIFWHYKSATPGKIILFLAIVDADTLQPPTMSQFVIRYLGYYVSAIVLFLGFFWIAFDKRKQGWHDKMANTVVIRKLPHLKE